MSRAPTPKPTLWRTCRVLANRKRLQILQCLSREPDQTVSETALRLKLPMPVASQYLRALEARGLLSAHRMGSRVKYSISAAQPSSAMRPLVGALRLAFQHEAEPIERIFKLATAFTHPRRVAVFHALKGSPQAPDQLRALVRIPYIALWRHLAKLEARGFVAARAGSYVALNRQDGVGRALARLASDS